MHEASSERLSSRSCFFFFDLALCLVVSGHASTQTCAQGSTGLHVWWSLLALSRAPRTSGTVFSAAVHDCFMIPSTTNIGRQGTSTRGSKGKHHNQKDGEFHHQKEANHRREETTPPPPQGGCVAPLRTLDVQPSVVVSSHFKNNELDWKLQVLATCVALRKPVEVARTQHSMTRSLR